MFAGVRMVKRKKQMTKKSRIKGRKPSNKNKDSKVKKLIKLAKTKRTKKKKR
ncbi:MAG TPA: hypothetical protein VJI32_01490 [Candidatus Nanoarchaeia archaeon]|nr:hypothetical protein [Candidatus Nanoarchaeia archaeon]